MMAAMGERLREWRLARGLTLREVGEAVAPFHGGRAVPRNSVANHERRGPTTAFLAALTLSYQNLDVSYMLTGKSGTLAAWETGDEGVYFSPKEATDEVRALIDNLVEAPFEYPKIFFTREEMTKTERTTYDMAALLALRMISRSLCTDARRFRVAEQG